MMYKNTRKLLALLLALMMCFSLLPLQAFAGEPEDEPPEEPEETHVCVYDAAVTEPGCTEGGYTTYSCPVCGDWYVDDYTDALGHTPEEGVCAVCGESIEGRDEFEALPEEPDGTVSAQNADQIELRNSGNVEINEENFPDDNFRAYVRESIAEGAGVLTPEQIEGQDNLSVSGKEIRSLQGVGIFTKLVTLDCSDNELTELDLSGNPMLKELDCSDNSLSTLDLSGCTALLTLDCEDNELSALAVGDCAALQMLDCSDNSLSTLDLSGCTALLTLDCEDNELSALDVGGCTALVWLDCSDNALSALDLSGYTALTTLYCSANKLTELNLSACAALVTLSCSDNELGMLNVSGCTALQTLNHVDSSLTTLNAGGCSSLTELCCYNTGLRTLNVSGCTALKKLYCYGNGLSRLNVRDCRKLTDLNCSGNGLSTLDLTDCVKLVTLNCCENELSALAVGDCADLVYLYCYGNKLSTLKLSGLTALEELDCRDNSCLSALDAGGCSSLEVLDCSNCSLSTLDLGGCESLMWLYCQNNSLSALDVSDCAALEELYCYNNRLSALDVSSSTSLMHLYCYNNSLSTLTLTVEDNGSVSGCTALETLYCYGNSLNALDLSGTALKDTVENGSAELGEIDGKSVIVFFRENSVLYVDAALARKGLNPPGLLPDSLALDRSYVLLKLKEGEEKGSVQLAVDGLDAQWTEHLLWTVSADGTPDGPATDVISVDENGKVSAEKVGTAYAVACLRKNGLERVAVCRVDVAENEPAEEITGVRLVDTKATVELYKSDYARVTVIPELMQNQQPFADAFTIPDPVPEDDSWENSGISVTGAKFADGNTNDRFLLRVVDDRTLEIIPRSEYVTLDAAVLKGLKSSYKSTILVTVKNGEDPEETFETAPLTLTVKKTAPKVTVKVDKLNSFIPGDTKPLIFTGAAVKAAVPDPDKETLQPGWLTYDEEAFTVTLNEDALDMRKSDKLYLLVQPEGWNVLMPVTVPVSAVQTMPKLSARPASVSLHPDADDAAFVDVMKTPTHFAGIAGWPVEAISVTESGKDASGALHILGEYGGVYFHLRPGAKAPTDGKAHTYKVTLALMRRNSDGSLTASPARTTLTVKLLASSTKLTLSAKAAGSIDTAIPGSYAAVTVTPKGVNPEFVHLDTTNWSELSVERQKGREEAETVTDDFEFSADYGELLSFRVKPVVELEKGYTYTLKIEKTIGGRELECSVKLPVKFSAKTPATAVSLKAAGALDPIRAQAHTSSVILTPTVKNWYNWSLDEAVLTVYDGSGKNANVVAQEDWPFSVRSEGDVYRVTLNYGAELDPKTDKYYISMTVNNVESARVALPIKMGAVKLAQSTKSVSLLKNDKNSSASLTISVAEDEWALNAIDWGRTQTAFISQTDRKGDPFFKLSCDGTGVCIIGYAGNNFLSAKNGTVKIPVFFEGNGSNTPNATIAVSVKIA